MNFRICILVSSFIWLNVQASEGKKEVTYRETFRGYMSEYVELSYEEAYQQGKAEGNEVEMDGRISISDLDEFTQQNPTSTTYSGWINSWELDVLGHIEGHFKIETKNSWLGKKRILTYTSEFGYSDEGTLIFIGTKFLLPAHPLVLKQAKKMNVDIYIRKNSNSGPVHKYRGILYFDFESLMDFAWSLGTNADEKWEDLRIKHQLISFFFGDVFF